MKKAFIRQGKLIMLLAVTIMLGAAGKTMAARERILAEKGKTTYVIVEPEKPVAVIKDTVNDLAQILLESTGAEFPIVPAAQADQHQRRIFVGYSSAMRAVAGELETLTFEERVYRTVGDDILIYGAGVCGTVFATYQFLQEQLHCRWFHPWGDSHIPTYERLVLPDCHRRMVPSYLMRDMTQRAWDASGCPTSTDFFRRQRTHNPGTLSPIRQIGLNVHTLPTFIPSGKDNLPGRNRAHYLFRDKAYFTTNPEFFSLDRSGKRTYLQHYCFSQPGLRRTLIANVEALVKGVGAEKIPAVINVDQADVGDHFCYCSACQELERQYQSPGGPLYDFLLEIGSYFREHYPLLLIRFLAYNRQQTELPPAASSLPGGRFPDNLIPYFAPLTGDFSKSWASPSNEVIYSSLAGWGQVSTRMWLYYYPTTFPRPLVHYPLFGNVLRCANDYQVGHQFNIRYIFNDEGFPLENMGFVSLQLYLRCMLANDATLKVETLVSEYMNNIYGPAADEMRRYFDELEELTAADDGYLRWNPDPRFVNYLTGENLLRWQDQFDLMEEQAAKDERALLHVRTARMNLDLNTMLFWPEVMAARPQWQMTPTMLHQRYLAGVKTVLAHSYAPQPDSESAPAARRQSYTVRNGWMLAAGEYAHAYASGGKPLPPPFTDIPADRVRRVIPGCNKTRVPPDERAAFGLALAADAPSSGRVGYRFTDSLRQLPPLSMAIPVLDGGDYQLYHLGRTILSRECSVIVPATGSGGTYGTTFLGHCRDKNHLEQLWDIYISCRFAAGKVYTDQIVLLKVAQDAPVLAGRDIPPPVERPNVSMTITEVAPAGGDPSLIDWGKVTPTLLGADALHGNAIREPAPELRLAFDRQYLYLSYEENRACGQETLQFWDNVVEIFLAGETSSPVLQIAVSPAGNVRCNRYTLLRNSEADRNEETLDAKKVPFAGKLNNQAQADRWRWQMAYPRQALPEITNVMQANFLRNHGEKKLSVSWNPIYVKGYLNGFHRLGKIYLGKEAAPVAP